MNFRDLFIDLFNEINISWSEELEAGNTFKYSIKKTRNFNMYQYEIFLDIKFKTEEDYRELFTCEFERKFYYEGINILESNFEIDNILSLKLYTESCVMCKIN